MPLTWVDLGAGDWRAQVEGGWLYRHDVLQGAKVIATAMSFVPHEVMTVQSAQGKNMLVVMASDGRNIGQSSGG